MKTKSFLVGGALLGMAFSISRAADPAPAVRVGTYDSRIVAFAHFWSEPASKSRNDLMAQARAAKTAGDTTKFKELSQQLSAMQTRDHLEVFSTAPANEALAALKEKLPAIQSELGVARLVSKWDAAALKGTPEVNRIDATDRLVREFLPAPTDKQQKTIAAMKKGEPLPLEKAKQLAAEGKL